MYKIITDIENLEPGSWAEFVKRHPNGNIFQTPDMYKIFSNTKNYTPVLVAVTFNGEIVSLLLAVIQSEFSSPIDYLTSRVVIDGGPLVINNDEELLKITLKKFKEITRKKSIYALFRNYWIWGDKINIFNQTGFKYIDHLNITVDLTRSIEEIWSSIHKYRRKEIKKAINKGVIVKLVDLNDRLLLDESYFILNKLYNKLKIPLPDKSIFDYSIELLGVNNQLKIFGAFLDNQLIGVRYVLCYNKEIFDWYAGSKDDFLPYHPNDILPWEIFKWGAENNYETFDFGGAGSPLKSYGVRDYKMKFGGELVSPGRFISIYNPLVYFLLNNLIKLRKLF